MSIGIEVELYSTGIENQINKVIEEISSSSGGKC